jgi:hypothetical protein
MYPKPPIDNTALLSHLLFGLLQSYPKIWVEFLHLNTRTTRTPWKVPQWTPYTYRSFGGFDTRQ